MTTDHYHTLGISPDAEDVVVRAAYRALAQRYHPDRWQGDAQVANARMAEVNLAYEVLSDPTRRRAYDDERARTASDSEFESKSDPDVEAAFDTALQEVNERWAVAVSIFPDLATLRQELQRYSKSLAFSFVTVLLDTKKFQERNQIARAMERRFLERFFGTDSKITEFAKHLIGEGMRDAALLLNRLVDVMGSEVNPDLLIRKVEADSGIQRAREQAERELKLRRHRLELVDCVNVGYHSQAAQLAESFGNKVLEIPGGFLSGPSIQVTTPKGETLDFKNRVAFVYWVKSTLCPLV